MAQQNRVVWACVIGLLAVGALLPSLHAQTDCEQGNGLLDFAPPKVITPQQVIERLAAAEKIAKEARTHYTFTQDVLIQTLAGKSVDGQFREVTSVSYNDKGKRVENLTYAEQSTLKRIQLSEPDIDDIRVFMPLMLATEDLPQYNLKYAGQQHVDDLDTYVFHVDPKKEEKSTRYFAGRIWVDSQDFQIVKVCGKSGPDIIHVKKHQRMDLRPKFVTYRQQVDGRYWFPAYTRSDETLRFANESIHIRETVKYTSYKRSEAGGAGSPAAKP